ncbi:MAG: M15 family metallopeptidase [Clostridia bacterium]|nr:M15 family metallopeptidase [Clostridia bacterium]
MKIKRKYRWLCLVLALAVLAAGIGYLATRGDWWYYLELAVRSYPEPELTAAQLHESDCTEWTWEDLKGADGVTVSCLLMLVNASHPLPAGYEAELTEYNGAEMHPLMVEPYIALRDTVLAETGVRIYVADDYRTAEEQMEILESSEEGTAAAPGCSEHEAGLSLDVYAPYCAGKEFLKSAAGRMVNRVCGEYGFVIRYPLGKEEITGISYEPWHLRYVGEPHAEIMMNSGLTLEEYIQALTPEVWFAHGNYLILRTAADACRLPQGWERCEISEDNAGYRIVTLKMP